ncbi:flagellar hook-length control protein FliK, partial [Rhizobium ruizarguesonis]
SDAAWKTQAEGQPETIVSVEKDAAKPAKAEVKGPADLALGKLDPKDRPSAEIAPSAKCVQPAPGEASNSATANTPADEDGGI